MEDPFSFIYLKKAESKEHRLKESLLGGGIVPAIEVSDLNFGYKEAEVVKKIFLKIDKGLFVSLIGPNGSGKSTIIKLLNHLYTPWKGKILVDNKDVTKYKKKDLAKKMALVPQNTIIDYEFSVFDIVMMGRFPYKNRFSRENQHDYNIVEKALKDTNTYHIKDKFITEVSGGERQRVLIAKAIAQEPEIILLDEPTAHLDINHQIEILNLLKKINKEENTTIILAIHDINLATRYSDLIYILKDGFIVDEGSPDKVITKNNIESTYNIQVAIDRNKYTNSLSITPLE